MRRWALAVISLAVVACGQIAGLSDFAGTGGAGGTTSTGGSGGAGASGGMAGSGGLGAGGAGGEGGIGMGDAQLIYASPRDDLLPVIASVGNEVYVATREIVIETGIHEIVELTMESGGPVKEVFTDAEGPVQHMVMASDHRLVWHIVGVGCAVGLHRLRESADGSSTNNYAVGCNQVVSGMAVDGLDILYSVTPMPTGVDPPSPGLFPLGPPTMSEVPVTPPDVFGPVAATNSTIFYASGQDLALTLFDRGDMMVTTPDVSPVTGEVTAVAANGSGVSFATNQGYVATRTNNGTIEVHSNDAEVVTSIVRDGQRLYWADRQKGCIYRSEDDGVAEALSCEQADPGAITLLSNPDALFWVNTAPGQSGVVRLLL